jgi:putative flippase GtrA
MKRIFSFQFLRFGIVGALNTLLGIGVFNLLMWVSGITRGIEISFFSLFTFAIVVTHSFFWNKFQVFKSGEAARREYALFFVVSSTTALVNVGIISLLVNVIGAPAWISPTLWANIALIVTIPVSMIGNFLGYSFFVFKKSGMSGPDAETPIS